MDVRFVRVICELRRLDKRNAWDGNMLLQLSLRFIGERSTVWHTEALGKSALRHKKR